ncbi:inactive leucine-rich repeat receptor-like protein kinase-like [Dorcoceras hygrometricum]|uniref:Inactive leucine-rich repeat receptor-like protein kinase-like n=1 Tax=Dorcoceras hygrometricum TaxID=472368 RepID=A0A2Z7C4W1_9LAMI|nr:inactive leucine-rich repeat receptor-like protein kinase-like [Dorcoceras hygrometricum]
MLSLTFVASKLHSLLHFFRRIHRQTKNFSDTLSLFLFIFRSKLRLSAFPLFTDHFIFVVVWPLGTVFITIVGRFWEVLLQQCGCLVGIADVVDPNGNLNSWNEDDEYPCKWKAVTCNPRSNRVTELVLDGFGLSGRLGRGLLQLQYLQKLSLARNNLTGSLSLSLAQLSDLRILELSENALSGSVSSDFFSQCGSLRSISLAYNQFSDQIPDSLASCAALVSLNFSGNRFSGLTPQGLWSLPTLTALDLSDNMLEGGIPEGIEALTNLSVISLRKNQFSGVVPDGIGSCLLLRTVDLSKNLLSEALPSTMQKLALCTELVLGSNRFTKAVPEWIGEMSSLEVLDISENNFTGRIPDSIGKLQHLESLNMSKNALSGSLPEAISNCVNLLTFDVSSNSLTGNLPSWVFNLGLEQLVISSNRLSGDIGSVLSSSTEKSRKSLVTLDVSQNDLSGEIPYVIGDFASLQFLSMARNAFSGSIPENIGGLNILRALELSDNQLNGSIPMTIGNCSSLMFLSLAHNEITGMVPASLANLIYLQIVDLSYNELTGNLPKQLADLVHLRSFNVAHNQLQGELPAGGFFNTISPSSVSGNPALCGAAVGRSCPAVMPKPIVLNPNSTDDTPGTIPQSFTHRKKILSISALIAIGAAAAIVIGVIAITVLNLRVRASASRSAVALAFSGGDDFSQSSSTDGDSGKLVIFSGDPDFGIGTHSLLNKDCELGRGGFGAVYQTTLKNGRSVAIKKLTVSSLVKSQDDFEKEVRKLGKIRHGNLVALDGYYWTPSLQLLIYEFVSGGNLYNHLHESAAGKCPNWNERFNILLGVAKGLSYLHERNVIHYNLKSSNILIDGSGEPKVADYGLARLLPLLDRYVLSSKIQSALGYMAPEFSCKNVKITEKCDVYAFGVLVLEIVTGKRPVEYMEDDVVVLSDMVRGALEGGSIEERVDRKLEGKFPSEEAIPLLKLGLICTSQMPSNRPDMAEVVNILELIRRPSEIHDESAGLC